MPLENGRGAGTVGLLYPLLGGSPNGYAGDLRPTGTRRSFFFFFFGEAARARIHKLARLGQGDFINSFSLSLKPLHNR